MAKVDSAGPGKRQMLSPKRRLWLAIWSLIRLLIVVPLWLFGLVALILGFALSPWGTEQLFTQGEKRGYFTYDHQEGALLDHFVLRGFNLALGETRVHIEDFELAWADDCLLSGRLCLDTLHVEGADIRVGSTAPSDEETDDAAGMPDIRLPFPIELRDVSLNSIDIHLADGTRIAWETFTTSAVAEHSAVHIASTGLINPTVYLPPSPGVQLTQGSQTSLMADSIDAAIQVVQPPADEPSAEDTIEALASREPLQLPDITLPIDIQLDDLTVSNLQLNGAFEYHVERLAVGLETQGNQVSITSLELVTPDANATLTANVTLADHYPLDAHLIAELWLPELFPELSGEKIDLALSGSLNELNANLSVSGVVSATLNGQVDAVSPTLPFDVRLQSERLQWPLTETADGSEPYSVESLDAHVTGNLEAYQVSLSLTAQGPEVPSTQISLSGEGDLTSFNWAPLALNVDGSSLRSEGQVSWVDPLQFDVHLQSDRLQWPLVEAGDETEAPYVIEDLNAHVTGTLDAYQAELSLTAQGPQVAPTQLNLTGQGDAESFQWSPLTLGVDESSLRSEGQVNWADALEVDSRIHLNRFDPSHYVSQLNGNLNGDIVVSVRQRGDVWEVNLPTLAIEGELQEYALTLEAALEANSDFEVNIQELLFTQGQNRLTASGQVSQEAMTLDADIALRQLQTLYPDLAGTLTGDIQARGSFTQPRLVAQLSGQNLRFAENVIEQLSLNANVQGVDDPRLEIGLELQQIVAGGQLLSSMDVGLNGRLSQHELTALVEGEPSNPLSRAALSLNGRFDQQRQRYQGRLSPLEIDSEVGDIRLDAPLDLSYNMANGQAVLSPFCLRREQGGLVCSDEQITASANQGQASLSLSEFPMEMLEPFLPEQWSFEGDTTADIEAAWQQGGARWQANAQVLSELAITAINDFGQPVQLPVIDLNAQLEANQAQADTTIVLSLSEAGDISLNLSVNDPLGNGVLDGELNANNVTFEPYQPMIVDMDRLEGDLNGRVRIGGTTSQPDLQGVLGLRNISVHGPEIPVDVRDGEFVVRFDGEQGDINGFVAAERGRLNISGDAYWPSGDDWRIGVDLNATEEPLLVVLPQFGRLEAAPDIRIRVTPERLQIRGDVNLPWARLIIGDLPASAIKPSSDEVIITEREDREAERLAMERAASGEPSAADQLAQTGMEMDILITLTLGEDMQFSAYGLESDLGGTLEVRQDSGALQLFGEVNLVDGRFRAFGQDLLIRRGQLLFSGPPGVPTLDFEAIRNPDITEDDVIAGLRVTGNAEEPNVAIFSEPAMDETRALSYLLRGRAPDEAGGGIDSALTTALIAMSLGRTGGAVGSIGETFGIHDLTLDTTGAGDDTQVAVSGQLTEDIRVSYGVGIFSPIAELTLRYTLWRNLYVQAVSGANQAVDLIYTFARPGNPHIYPRQ